MRNPALEQYISGVVNNQTPQEIFEQVNAPHETYSDIPLAELEAFLNKRGLMRQLRAIIADQNAPQQIRDGLTDFLEHLNSRSTILEVTEPEVRAKFVAILRALTLIIPNWADSLSEVMVMGVNPSSIAERQFGGQVTMDEVTEAYGREKLMSKTNILFQQLRNAIYAANPPTGDFAEIVDNAVNSMTPN